MGVWRRSYIRRVMRRLRRMAHLFAVLPSHHSCLSETESRSPQSVVSWSPTASCLCVHHVQFASSSCGSSPTSAPAQKILHYRPERAGKWSLPRRPWYFCCQSKTWLIRKIPVVEINVLRRESRVVSQLFAPVEALRCVIRDLKPSSNSLCLSMQRKRLGAVWWT